MRHVQQPRGDCCHSKKKLQNMPIQAYTKESEEVVTHSYDLRQPMRETWERQDLPSLALGRFSPLAVVLAARACRESFQLQFVAGKVFSGIFFFPEG